MNILGLVFSLLLILSYGFFSCWDKQVGSAHLRKTYVGHESANRKILNKYQSEIYDNLRSKPNPEPPQKVKAKPKKTAPPEPKAPDLNRACSQINLWPLIQEGRSAHPLLYELTAKMIRRFYEPLHRGEKRFEYHFLDALLIKAKLAAQAQTHLALEKIDLEDADLQRSYYQMLKGTKKWDLNAQIGFPSLLDYVKAEVSTDKLCIFHAHPDLITVLFNSKIGSALYEEIHKKNAPLLTQELIERICSENHLIGIDQKLFEFLELGRPEHEENKKTFIAEDQESKVSLKKNFYLKG